MLLTTFVRFVLFFVGYFATEENEEKREIREKQKERKAKTKRENLKELIRGLCRLRGLKSKDIKTAVLFYRIAFTTFVETDDG